jgi:hypothetical protein
MDYAVFSLLTGLLQIAGAVYAFEHDGVLAKMLGLLFCIVGAICIMASIVFFNDEKANRRKGNKQ